MDSLDRLNSRAQANATANVNVATVDAGGQPPASRELIDIMTEISLLLNTSLGRKELSLCMALIENGVHPGTLAAVIQDLRREAKKG